MNAPNRGSWMMLGATLAWGTSYLFMQHGLHTIQPFNLIALRFGIGFAVALIPFYGILRRASKQILLESALLGFLLNLCFYLVMLGLRSTTTGKAGFLLGSAVVFVQLETAILQRKLPGMGLVAATVLAMTGIAALTLKQDWRIGTGDLFCLASAFGYSWHIVLTGHLAKRTDPLSLGIFQLGWVALFALAGSLIVETPHLPHGSEAWVSVLVLGILCSAAGFILQTKAQALTDTAKIGILYAMEPVFALLLGILILREPLTLRASCGIVCILLALFCTRQKK